MKKFKLPNNIQKITHQLIEHYQPEKVILFGSYAEGNASKDSDIDLFIVKKTMQSYHDRVTRAYQVIHNEHDEPIDIIVYTPQEVDRYNFPGTFVSTILNQGYTLYEKR